MKPLITFRYSILLGAILAAGGLTALAPVAIAMPSANANSAAQTAAASAWLQSAHPGSDPTDVHVSIHDLPFTGAAVWTVKGLDRASGLALANAFDAQGNQLADRGEKLVAAEWAARWTARGGIRDPLWSKLAEMAPGQTLPVSIWLRTDEPDVNKELLVNDIFAAANDMYLRAVAHATAKAKFIGEFRTFSQHQLDDQPSAPLMMADLTKAEILAIAKSRSVGWIDVREVPVAQSSTIWVDSLMASAGSSGKDGSGEAVCVMERYLPSSEATLTIRSRQQPNGTTDDHARIVVGAVRSSAGVAGTGSGAYIDVANSNNTPLSGQMAFCGGGVVLDYIWNYSWNCDTSTCRGLVDYWTMIGPYPTITLAGGNLPNAPTRDTTLGTAYNAVVVGGIDDKGTSSRSDDSMWFMNADLNYLSDWELPNLVAPAAGVVTDGLDPGNGGIGTSVAAPMVAGIAAQIHQTNNDLRPWPEATRAILMCSANRDVDGGRLSLVDSIDDRDGAGEANATLAVQLASASNKVTVGNTPVARGIDYQYFSPAYAPSGTTYSGKYYMKTTESSKRARVVFTWDAHATCTNWSSSSNLTPPACDAQVLDADLDIQVYDETDSDWKGISNTTNGNWEFVEFVAEPDHVYRVEIVAYNWFNASTYYGIAWNFDEYAAN